MVSVPDSKRNYDASFQRSELRVAMKDCVDGLDGSVAILTMGLYGSRRIPACVDSIFGSTTMASGPLLRRLRLYSCFRKHDGKATSSPRAWDGLTERDHLTRTLWYSEEDARLRCTHHDVSIRQAT